MTLTFSFGLNIKLQDRQLARFWSIPILSKTVQLKPYLQPARKRRQAASTLSVDPGMSARSRDKQAPGRLAVLTTVAGIVATSLLWGLR